MSKSAIRVIFVALTVWAGEALAAAQTPKLTVIHSFTGNADGETPHAGVILDENGNIYGTTWLGGKIVGTVFKINAKGKLSVLHTFTNGADGGQPEADLVRDPQGNLYGTTAGGGAHHNGTAFKIDSTGHLSVLHSFGGTGTDLITPQAAMILDSAGNLYGTGGAGTEHAPNGGVFRLSKTGREKLLYVFRSSPDGSQPLAGLTRYKEGNLFGTTFSGGSDGFGTVFELDSTGHETVLFSFPGKTQGVSPFATLIQDSAGNLYGTTYGTYVGTIYYGTVFKLDPSGTQTVLHVFTGDTDGGHPVGKLVMDNSGNMYGTASVGGASHWGVIFKLDSAGNYSVLHSFSGSDGANPGAGLVLDAKGALYGTTALGGKFGKGTVFKFTNP